MSLTKKVLIAVLVILIGIQFIRPTKNEGELEGEEHISRIVNVPDNVKIILNTACYDCHSNKTQYPWYSEIMPIGWWLNSHVKEGKEHLNFSEFAAYSPREQETLLEETVEEVKEHEMPISSYTWYHKEAKLTKEQVIILSDWVEKSRISILK